MPYAIGIDIGASNIRIALANSGGRIISKVVESTPKSGNNLAIPKLISSMINTILQENSISLNEILGIGIGSIGPIDLNRGIILKTANLPFKKIPLVSYFKNHFNTNVILVNDCVAGVIGEHIFGAGKMHENLVYITISTGIGAGVYVDGKPLIGKDGNAHEVGHMIVDPKGKLTCGCGGKGHWEAYSSGSGIPKLVKLILSKKDKNQIKESLLLRLTNNIEKIDAKTVYEAAKLNDKLALEIIEQINKYNIIGFANIINVYDPSLITVGGSITLNNPDLVLNPIRQNVKKYIINRPPEIMLTPLGEDVVLYGAIAIALGFEEIKHTKVSKK
ncbi:MAG: ROK family protein [Thermoprotei archaeon]